VNAIPIAFVYTALIPHQHFLRFYILNPGSIASYNLRPGNEADVCNNDDLYITLARSMTHSDLMDMLLVNEYITLARSMTHSDLMDMLLVNELETCETEMSMYDC